MLVSSLAALALAFSTLGAPAPAPAPAAVDIEARGAPTNGINDYNCRATPGKDPILFLHGLNGPAGLNWITKAPIFSAKGYCTYTPQYGTVNGIILGGAAVEDSTAQISAVVDKILATSGASKINIVGHSLGTLVTSYYLKYAGGANKVANFVGIGPVVRGTTLYGIGELIRAIPGGEEVAKAICKSCDQLVAPNAFLNHLQQGGIKVPGPTYTLIASKLDAVVVPYTNGFIYENGVTNIAIQDHCGLDISGHISQVIDPNVTELILWALKGRQGGLPSCLPFLVPGKRDVSPEVTDPNAPSVYFPSG